MTRLRHIIVNCQLSIRRSRSNTNLPFQAHSVPCPGREGGHEQSRENRVGIPQNLRCQQPPISQRQPCPDQQQPPASSPSRPPGLRSKKFSASHFHSSNQSVLLYRFFCMLSLNTPEYLPSPCDKLVFVGLAPNFLSLRTSAHTCKHQCFFLPRNAVSEIFLDIL